MANKKKPTNKEMIAEIGNITRHVNFVSRMLDSIGVALSNYIKFKGDEEDFKNYLENKENLHKLTKEEENERKNGHSQKNNEVPDKKIRKKSDGKS